MITNTNAAEVARILRQLADALESGAVHTWSLTVEAGKPERVGSLASGFEAINLDRRDFTFRCAVRQ